jgi:hypothetical protein
MTICHKNKFALHFCIKYYKHTRGNRMNGKIMVSYKVLCKTDLNTQILLSELLCNERVQKTIKNEYAKGMRNIEVVGDIKECMVHIQTQKEIYSFEVQKDDYADLLVLAEEDALNNKRIKKDCDLVELVDIQTL